MQVPKCKYSIARWDVSNVRYMSGMFQGATSFNGDISNWQVSNVLNMNNMFRDATSFNHKLCGERWVHSEATTTSMFAGSTGSISKQVCNTRPVSTEACDMGTTNRPRRSTIDHRLSHDLPSHLAVITTKDELKTAVQTYLILCPTGQGEIRREGGASLVKCR